MPALRCACPRCAGGVTYLLVSDYLAAHEGMADSVLEGEVEASKQRHPSRIGPRVGTFDDGEQVYVIGQTVARRRDKWATWEAPVELEEDE